MHIRPRASLVAKLNVKRKKKLLNLPFYRLMIFIVCQRQVWALHSYLAPSPLHTLCASRARILHLLLPNPRFRKSVKGPFPDFHGYSIIASRRKLPQLQMLPAKCTLARSCRNFVTSHMFSPLKTLSAPRTVMFTSICVDLPHMSVVIAFSCKIWVRLPWTLGPTIFNGTYKAIPESLSSSSLIN